MAEEVTLRYLPELWLGLAGGSKNRTNERAAVPAGLNSLLSPRFSVDGKTDYRFKKR